MKTFWQSALEHRLDALTTEVESRKAVSVNDQVADGIHYACREIGQLVRELTAPGRFLTPAQWGASQPRKVDEQTVRRWIQRGELDAMHGARGFLIPAGATRRVLRKVG